MNEDEALKEYCKDRCYRKRYFSDREIVELMESERKSIGFEVYFANIELLEAIRELKAEIIKTLKSIYYWIVLKLKRIEG